MDLEHPAISKTLKEGYPDDAGKPQYKNNIHPDYNRVKEEKQMNDKVMSFVDKYNQLKRDLRAEGVINVRLDDMNPHLQFHKVADFFKHTKGHNIKFNFFEDDDTFECEATAQIGEVEYLILLEKDELVELEGLLDE